MKRAWLQVVVNVATITVLAATGSMLWHRYTAEATSIDFTTPKGTYAVGDRLDDVVPVDYRQASRTVLVVVQQGCEYCEASIPFYRRMLQERVQRHANVRVAFVTPPRTNVDVLLSGTGVVPDAVVQFKQGFRVFMTPTLLLVGPDGRVVNVRSGQLTPAQETEVLDTYFAKS